MTTHSFTTAQLEAYVSKRIHDWENGGRVDSEKKAREKARKKKLSTAGNFKLEDLPKAFHLTCVTGFSLSLHEHKVSHQDRRACMTDAKYQIQRVRGGFGIKNDSAFRSLTGETWWAFLTGQELLTYFKR